MGPIKKDCKRRKIKVMKKNKDKGKPCLIRDSAEQLQRLPGINSRRKNKPLLDPYIDDEDDEDDEDDSNNDDGGA